MRRSPKTSCVQTLSRGLALLEVLYGHEDGLSLHDLSQVLKCPKPSLLRLLDTLVERGYLHVDPAGGRYSLDALHLLRASNLYRPTSGRCAAIRLVLQDLSRRTGETAALAVLDPRGGSAATVDHIEPSHVVRAVPPVYRAMPALRASLGRAWLAWLDDAEALETAHRWAAAAGESPVEAAQDLADVAAIRSQGYAVVLDAEGNELAVIAAVVTDGDGRPFGGTVVLAPAFRVGPGRIPEMGRAVRTAATMLSNVFARDSIAQDLEQDRELVGASREH
jgi:DNA-binding IclR family transcriptional regulator